MPKTPKQRCFGCQDLSPFNATVRWSVVRHRLDGDDSIRGEAGAIGSYRLDPFDLTVRRISSRARTEIYTALRFFPSEVTVNSQ